MGRGSADKRAEDEHCRVGRVEHVEAGPTKVRQAARGCFNNSSLQCLKRRADCGQFTELIKESASIGGMLGVGHSVLKEAERPGLGSF
jgi:hypothetical protein